MPDFYQSYLDQLDKKKIIRYCKKCVDYEGGLCPCINDGLGAIARFCECDVLQEVF